MSDANEAAWTTEGGRKLRRMQPTRAGEGIGSQPGNGVAEEAGEVQEALPVDRTPEEEFLAQMLAATGATNLQEAGLYDPVEVAAEEERIEEEMSPEERQAKAEHDAPCGCVRHDSRRVQTKASSRRPARGRLLASCPTI